MAIFAIYMLNKSWSDRLNEQMKALDEQREMWRCTREALEENTKVITVWLERNGRQ